MHNLPEYVNLDVIEFVDSVLPPWFMILFF